MCKILFFLFVCWMIIGCKATNSVNVGGYTITWKDGMKWDKTVNDTSVPQEQVTISRFQGERITGLDFSLVFDITIRQGKNTGVTLSIPASYEKYLVFENYGGKIRVGFKDLGKRSEHKKYGKFTAEIVCSSLEEVELSGTCKLKGVGDFTAKTVEFDLSGSSKVFLNDLKVVKSGEIELSGASQLQANVVVPEIGIDISGAAKLTLTGKADRGESELSGASKANLENFVLKNLTLSTSGASKASVNVTESLIVEASGVSHISYSGNPRVSPHISGGPTLEPR